MFLMIFIVNLLVVEFNMGGLERSSFHTRSFFCAAKIVTRQGVIPIVYRCTKDQRILTIGAVAKLNRCDIRKYKR